MFKKYKYIYFFCIFVTVWFNLFKRRIFLFFWSISNREKKSQAGSKISFKNLEILYANQIELENMIKNNIVYGRLANNSIKNQ